MYGLFVILNDVHKLETIHEIFYEVGVGATTLDSVGMGKVLLGHNENIPVFSSIRRLVEGNKPYNKTIISVIREKEKLDQVVDKVNHVLDNLKKPGTGFMFVVPVIDCYGSKLNKGDEIK